MIVLGYGTTDEGDLNEEICPATYHAGNIRNGGHHTVADQG